MYRSDGHFRRPTMPTLRPADVADLDALVRHLEVHVAESGRAGAPYFAPSRTFRPTEVRDLTRARMERRLDEPNWGRIWLLLDDVDEAPSKRGLSPPRPTVDVVGHVELRGGRLFEELHRATLGIGILEGFRGQGNGRRLLSAAIDWAVSQPFLAYIDLGVFAENHPARRLYRRAGFVERGRLADAFRIDGSVIIDDIQMTLALRGPAP